MRSSVALTALAAFALSACSASNPARSVSTNLLPEPVGQSFFVMPAEGDEPDQRLNQIATAIAAHMASQGYAPARSPGDATLLVKLDYDIDITAYRSPARPHDALSTFSRHVGTSMDGQRKVPAQHIGGPWSDHAGYKTVYRATLELSVIRQADNQTLFKTRSRARSATPGGETLVPMLARAALKRLPVRRGGLVIIGMPVSES